MPAAAAMQSLFCTRCGRTMQLTTFCYCLCYMRSSRFAGYRRCGSRPRWELRNETSLCMHQLLTITCVDVQLLACFRESILVPVASVSVKLKTCASTSVQASHLRSNGVTVLNSSVCFLPFRGILKAVTLIIYIAYLIHDGRSEYIARFAYSGDMGPRVTQPMSIQPATLAIRRSKNACHNTSCVSRLYNECCTSGV